MELQEKRTVSCLEKDVNKHYSNLLVYKWSVGRMWPPLEVNTQQDSCCKTSNLVRMRKFQLDRKNRYYLRKKSIFLRYIGCK